VELLGYGGGEAGFESGEEEYKLRAVDGCEGHTHGGDDGDAIE